MDSYSYKELNITLNEIRLIRLKHGNWDEEISFSIFHAPLNPVITPKPVQRKRLSVKELQKGLPDGYVVKETLSGRYIFGQRQTDIMQSSSWSSWNHPSSDIDRALYELVEEEKEDDDDDDDAPAGGSFHGYEPKYEALSYTWATEKDPVHAYVVDEASEANEESTATVVVEVQLGGNLACALQHLRSETEDRVLWVDALCIDQNNETEKNLQVRRMGSIYSLASRVVAWLGLEGRDSAHAISTLRDLGDQVEVAVDGSLSSAPGASQPDWWYPFHHLPYDERTWSSVTNLFQRSWFSRVWVVQEVLLANRHTTIVHCGRDTIPWITLQKAMAILAAKRIVPRDLTSSIQYQGYGIFSPTRRTLPRLLSFSKYRKCSVAHDKLYGILSLSSRSLSDLISPDYSKPVHEAFADACRAQLAVTRRLEFLPFCWSQQRCPDGPSWVPDWNAAPMNRLFFFRVLAIRQASGFSAADVSFPSSKSLAVRGRRCARVDSVGPVAVGSPKDVLGTIIRSWEPLVVGLRGTENRYVSGGCSMLDALLEVAFQGCLRERWPRAVSWPTLPELREKYLAAAAHGKDTGDDDENDILELLKNGVANDAMLFTTDEGYLGVSQEGIKTGDIICTMLGCDLPMVLRPVGRDEFHVVGFCFVHGLMDGESLLGPLTEPWKLRFIFRDGSYVPEYYHVNPSTLLDQQQQSWEDPRLGPLPDEWERIAPQRERTQDDPEFFQLFRNKQTGKVMNSDPRLLPAALIQQGGQLLLETFRLI